MQLNNSVRLYVYVLSVCSLVTREEEERLSPNFQGSASAFQEMVLDAKSWGKGLG